jgi:cobaltochelatase CobN
MAYRPLTFVVIDANGMQLALLGRAVAALPPEEATQIRAIARSRDDLFDSKQVAACVRTVGEADGLILLPHGGPESIPGCADLLAAARGKLVHVQASSMSQDDLALAKDHSSGWGTESYQRRHAYLRRGGIANLQGLLVTMARELGADLPEPPPPMDLPSEGIYHPEWPGDIKDRDGYLAWARKRRGLAADAPVIGLWFGQGSWVNGDLDFADALIAAIEAKGGVPLAVFHMRYREAGSATLSVGELIDHFFRKDGKTIIEAMLSPMCFSLSMLVPDSEKLLRGLDVPLLQLIQTGNPTKVWSETEQGVSPMDVSINAAQPEFDGSIIGTVISCRDEAGADPVTGARLTRRTAVADRCRFVASWAMNWARLRRTPPAKRKVAIIFHGAKNDRLGGAAGLDSFESVKLILERLKAAGYVVDRGYETGEKLAFEMLDRLTNDRRYLAPAQMIERAAGIVDKPTAVAWHADRSPRMRKEMEEKWGEVPGVTFCYEGKLLVGGIVNGNVFLGMQPPRARMEEGDEPALQPDGKTIHDPYLPSTHHYLGYYRWLRDEFGAHVIYHIGTHGTLEWMPGKSLGLSRDCYPDAAIADLPHLYLYIISNPGEGTQAKRRSYACLLDHMIAPQTSAGKTEQMGKIEDLLERAYFAKLETPTKVPLIVEDIWTLAEELHLDADLGFTRERALAEADEFMGKLHGYLNEVSVCNINDGLHIFGTLPPPQRFNETMVHLTRLPNGDNASLWDAIALSRGFDGEDLRDHPGELVSALGKTKGQVLEAIVADACAAMGDLDAWGWDEDGLTRVVEARFGGSQRVLAAMRFVAEQVRPKLAGIADEMTAAEHGAEGGFIPPGGSGCPTRGCIDILPTGRNFFSIDPYKIPTPDAWKVGIGLAESLVERYRADEGKYPEQIAIVLWATSTMRTRGDEVAEILYLMGVRPVWNPSSGRVKDIEVIPLEERTFPRMDVTIRASGLLRDTFPNVQELLDRAARMVAALDEPPELNFLARNVAVDRAELLMSGLSPAEVEKRAACRVYSERPGCYGAGVKDLLESGQWEIVNDLGEIYINWGGYAYGEGVYGEARHDDFRRRLSRVDLTVKNEESRESDIFTSDDFNSYHGGLNAAVKTASGRYARSYNGDSSDPRRPKTRSTDEEGRFVFRTRILNPKWIEGMKRHGYKGAGDLSKQIDICYQWDASSNVLDDWQYEEMAKTYAFDPEMQKFFREHNPYALHNIVERLLEAISRGLWENPGDDKEKLEALLLEAEGSIEDCLSMGMGKATADTAE